MSTTPSIERDLLTLKHNRLKEYTLTNSNIEFKDHYYRYINHIDRLATTGFNSRERLVSYSDTLRFDTNTVKVMQQIYRLLFN